jgi:hypothetical protein
MKSSPFSSPVTRFAAFVAGLCAFVGMWLVVSGHSALLDTDAYFHLAVARRYHLHGVWGGLPWARLSLMREGFGDKELLFHLIVAPFTWFGPMGGRFLVAALNGLVAGAVARLAVRAIGAWGLLVPFWLLVASYDYLSRVLLLRPEMLLLLGLLLAVECAARKKYLGLAVVAFLLTWSHTGFPFLLVLCGAWLAVDRIATGQTHWRLLSYPSVGMAAALLLHPQTPHHLIVWWAQNVQRYMLTLPDQGGEFQANTLMHVLRADGGYLLGLAAWIVWRAAGAGRLRFPAADPLGRYLGVAAVLCAVLFALLARFATLLMPFAALAVLFLEGGEGRRPGSTAARLARGLALVLAVSAGPLMLGGMRRMGAEIESQGVYFAGFEPLARQFGLLIPDGAKVAAKPGDAEFYAYFAPWGRYLNVLDPVFMAVPHPREYRTYVDVFAGQEADAPLLIKTVLDSDYVALFSLSGQPLGRRLSADPRVTRAERGQDSLFEIHSGANSRFLLDWRLVPVGLKVDGLRVDPGWPAYPRATTKQARDVEAFVDLRRIGDASGCRILIQEIVASSPAAVLYEFAPYGPGQLWLDGSFVLSLGGAPQAVLGQGGQVNLPLPVGSHTLAVRSCPAGGQNGFFLLERSRSSLPERPPLSRTDRREHAPG